MSSWLWPTSEAPRAFQALAASCGLGRRDARVPPTIRADDPALWIPAAASALEVEVEAVSATYEEIPEMIRVAAPALFVVGGPGDDPRVVGVVRAGRRHAHVVVPDGRPKRVRLDELVDLLSAPLEREVMGEVDRTISMAGIAAARVPTVRRALLRERLSVHGTIVGWMLRHDPGESGWRAASHLGIPQRAALQALAHLAKLAFTLGGWWTLGRSMFEGRIDAGWIAAASLLFASAVPFELAESWLAGATSYRLGGWLRQRLLVGALRMSPDEVRLDGMGAHLGRVIESESVQAVALTGATASVLGVLEIVASTFVLAGGAGGFVHALSLVAWAAVLVVVLARYVKTRRAWTDARLSMSAHGIERLFGYETRLVCESPSEWSIDEDRELSEYVDRSREADRRLRHLTVLVARGWLLVGLIGLVPPLLAGSASALGLAIGVGGVLLAYEALGNLALQVASLVDAGIGWKQVKPLFDAASQRPRPTLGLRARRGDDAPDDTRIAPPLLELRDVIFAYPRRTRPVLEGASLRIEDGDRILVEGPSGAGKSTLAALLSGLRLPSSGLVLQRGLDLPSIGEEAWRHSAAFVPQFHDNHMLCATLAFNLLFGRQWPPVEEDAKLGNEICHDLGLGPVIKKMPSGYGTMVGEIGWQLSHGERSRIFLARALLQGADIVMLDETLAALDPESLSTCVGAALKRAKTLLVITHARTEKEQRGDDP